MMLVQGLGLGVPDERHEQLLGLTLGENIIKKSMIPVDEGVEEKDGPVSLQGKKYRSETCWRRVGAEN